MRYSTVINGASDTKRKEDDGTDGVYITVILQFNPVYVLYWFRQSRNKLKNERKEFSFSVLTPIHDTSAREGRATCVFKHDSNVCFHMYSHGFIVIIDSLCKEIHVKP